MIDYFVSEPMKYFAPPASINPEMKRLRISQMIDGGNYIWSRKIDGNWSRAVVTPERQALQTRGISKKTGTYGEVQNKVFFWNDVVNAFSDTTVILGEIYMPGCIDKDVGSILRCLDDKALARQKDKKLQWYIFDVLCYEGQNLMNTSIEERIKYIDICVKKINNPLVKSATYHQMDDNFFDDIAAIFADGGEGVVCYQKDAIYEPGKRGPHAWQSLKVKQEIAADVDCFLTSIESPTRDYTGKEISSWQYWLNTRTGEKINSDCFGDYQLGAPVIPITKNYYYNYPGAIFVGVYNKNKEIVNLCKVAGLTDEFKQALRDDFDKYYMMPMTIGGMMVSTAKADESGAGISIRHPFIKSIRSGDLNVEDCTLEKILS